MAELATPAAHGVREAGDGFADAVLRDCLAQFAFARLRVTGDCMRPSLMPGDSVRVAAPHQRPPRWGDVVLVRHDAGLRLHRLIWGPPLAAKRSRWLTKGDRAAHWDRWLASDQILGVVIGADGRTWPRRDARWRTVGSLLGGLRAWLRAPAAGG